MPLRKAIRNLSSLLIKIILLNGVSKRIAYKSDNDIQ